MLIEMAGILKLATEAFNRLVRLNERLLRELEERKR